MSRGKCAALLKKSADFFCTVIFLRNLQMEVLYDEMGIWEDVYDGEFVGNTVSPSRKNLTSLSPHQFPAPLNPTNNVVPISFQQLFCNAVEKASAFPPPNYYFYVKCGKQFIDYYCMGSITAKQTVASACPFRQAPVRSGRRLSLAVYKFDDCFILRGRIEVQNLFPDSAYGFILGDFRRCIKDRTPKEILRGAEHGG